MNKDFHFLCIVHCVHVDFFNVFTVGEGSLILTCAKFWKKVPSLQKKKKENDTRMDIKRESIEFQ